MSNTANIRPINRPYCNISYPRRNSIASPQQSRQEEAVQGGRLRQDDGGEPGDPAEVAGGPRGLQPQDGRPDGEVRHSFPELAFGGNFKCSLFSLQGGQGAPHHGQRGRPGAVSGKARAAVPVDSEPGRAD